MKKEFFLLSLIGIVFACSKNNPSEQSRVIDFEAPDCEAFLAGPSAYGENCYSSYTGDPFVSYTDPPTSLSFGLNFANGSYDLWNGGIVLSRWNDTRTANFTNQCSVYYRDALTGKGGNKGSATFLVSSGYDSDFGSGPSLYFADGTPRIIASLYVNNAAYPALCMQNGNDFARAFSYRTQDWFKVSFTGIDAQGQTTGTVDCYLADYRIQGQPKLLDRWEKVDLRGLGAIIRLKINISGTDAGDYGLNTPAYCCLDDIEVMDASGAE